MKLVEEIVIMFLFMAMAMVALLIFADRNQKIENGELVQVSERYMDR